VRLLGALAGGLIGFVIGYFIGVYAGCDWLYPTSNLCGMYGMILTGPLGLVAGGIGGWRVSRPQKR
jgi:hypothetical protein